MAALCVRLWGLQLNLWLLALLTGGISADQDSSTGSRCPAVQQPRYVAAKRNSAVHFLCASQQPSALRWYRAAQGSRGAQELDHNSSHHSVQRAGGFLNFTIFRVTSRDNGVYVCDSKDLGGQNRSPHLCGTELRVMGHINSQQLRNRSTLKDTIIIVQSVLLVVFLSAPLLLLKDKGEAKESPEEDHTYEGLEVEQMATYEDISAFRDMKVKWTVGEHPGEE